MFSRRSMRPVKPGTAQISGCRICYRRALVKSAKWASGATDQRRPARPERKLGVVEKRHEIDIAEELKEARGCAVLDAQHDQPLLFIARVVDEWVTRLLRPCNSRFACRRGRAARRSGRRHRPC